MERVDQIERGKLFHSGGAAAKAQSPLSLDVYEIVVCPGGLGVKGSEIQEVTTRSPRAGLWNKVKVGQGGMGNFLRVFQ